MGNTQFLRQYWKPLLIWPTVAAMLGVILWMVVLSGLRADRETVRNDAYQKAISRTSAYSQQIARTIQQIDQTTLLVQYQWKKTNGNVDLDELRANGIFPKESFDVTIADQNGAVVTSTIPFNDSVSFADHEWFQRHKLEKLNDLFVDQKDISLRTGKPVVRLSRRLENADGTFAGATWVTVTPPYLTTFYDGKNLGVGEFISLRLKNGPLLATRAGGGKYPYPVFYKQFPSFSESEGITQESGEKFWDNQPRVVAWKYLEPYPLLAISALTEEEIYAGYTAYVQETIKLATAVSILLLLLAALGAGYSARLAWRKQQDEETKSIFRLAVDGAREGFYIVRPTRDGDNSSPDFCLVDCNECGAEMMGKTKEQLIKKKYSELHGDESFICEVDFLKRALESAFYEDELRVPSSSPIKADWIHRKAVRSGSGLAITIRDITDTKEHEQALVTIANVDSLTGLPNRHWLKNYLPSAIDLAKHYHLGLAVLFIDLDNFKNINDTLGHVTGDAVLKSAATRLRSLVRHSDHVVRLGGDEFTIILEQVHRTEDISRIADQAIEELSKPFAVGFADVSHIRASIGISLFPHDGTDGETLLKHADIAMYSAKAAGKGRYHFYQSHLSDRIDLRVSREKAIREAIERDEFVLYYQPRADTFTGRLRSMEALVRWIHPERGFISPVEFIQIAEETGLIIKIGEQVIAKACAQLAEWKAQGLPLVSISINVSVSQFNEGKVKDILASYMTMYRIDPDLLGVEITESCMVAENTAVPEEINSLRSLGVKLLIDDFGTGYSSLSQLQRLDFDLLKIDQAFTRQLDDSEEGKAFFKAIVSMGQALNMEIVAEGVETEEQLRILQELSCNEVQGYYVSRPVSAQDVPAMLKKIFLFPNSSETQSAVL
jgi:diguanylate cyclase (GGDEF)-like protein